MNQRTITIIGAVIIALLLLGLIFTFSSSSKIKKNLSAEKMNSEKIISEKSAVENELAKLKSDFNNLKQLSDGNERLLAETKSKMAENESRLNYLARENRTLRGNPKELADLQNKKAELENQYSQLKSENDAMAAQIRELQNTINKLESERNTLAAELEKAQLYFADDFLVTATRGKKTERVVARASRAKKLNVAFEVPQSLTESITFTILTPAGTLINPGDKGISWYFTPDSRNFTVSLSPITGEFERSRQIVLNYVPTGKLIKGDYKIQILSNYNNIGNCRLRLK